MRIPRPTYAGVTATVALFVALGGSSYAAITISGSSIRNGTVTTADVKDGSLRARDVKNGTLTAADVKNGSLLAADFKAGELPAGPAGPAGPQGATGPQGPAGATNVVARSEDVTVAAGGGTATRTAECQTGEVAVGGGAGLSGAANGSVAVFFDEPREADGSPPEEGDVPTSWHAGAVNAGPQPRDMTVYVICASP
jgi:hypothetical protein